VAFAAQPEQLINSPTFYLARAAAYGLVNVYMIKMGVVFMVATSTVAIYTGIAPRWEAPLTACAVSPEESGCRVLAIR